MKFLAFQSWTLADPDRVSTRMILTFYNVHLSFYMTYVWFKLVGVKEEVTKVVMIPLINVMLTVDVNLVVFLSVPRLIGEKRLSFSLRRWNPRDHPCVILMRISSNEDRMSSGNHSNRESPDIALWCFHWLYLLNITWNKVFWEHLYLW